MSEQFDISGYEPLPRHSGLFFTGVAPTAGKTVVAGAVGHYLASQGQDVDPFVPVALGCRRSRGDLVSDEAAFLSACVDTDLTLAQVSPMRLTTRANPAVAGEEEDLKVDLNDIFDGYRLLCGRDNIIIVEAAGGLMFPITEQFHVVHLAAMMALPLVLVARPEEGVVNHTLLTLHVARDAGLSIAGVVINRYDPETDDPAARTAAAQIAELGKVDILAIFPEDGETSVADARLGADTQFAASQGPWEKIIKTKY